MTQTPITISQLPDLGAAQGTDRAAVDRLGTPVSAGAFAVGQAYQIVTVGNTNFTTIGAESNTVGAYFVATGVGTGSGTAAPINTGDVALSAVAALVTKAGLGLDAVDNTSDADKPVSTAVQQALNGKAAAGAIGSSGLTMGPGILLRETGTGAPQVYSLGSGLSIVGGALVVTSGGAGSVTSVGLSAPTGFTVTGSPVIASGTLALGFALGYSLPTDARQGDWDTAFLQRQQWDGGSQHLDAAVGRASLVLGTAAQSATTDFISATATRSANVVLAGPATGPAAAPTFRALVAADLPATAVAPGGYGSATAVGSFTVDTQGRLTAASSVTISIPAIGISDSTTTGRAVLTAADQAAGRSAIGAEQAGAAAAAQAFSIQRGNHTGTQPASTISDFTSAARATVSAGGALSYNPTTGVVSYTAPTPFDPASPGAIGGTAPAAATFTAGAFTQSLLLPANWIASPLARMLAVLTDNTLAYRDNTGAEQRVLVASRNLSGLADPALALANLGGLPRTVEIVNVAYASTINIDFAVHNGKCLNVDTLAGPVTFTFSNISQGRFCTVDLLCDSTARALTFPATTPFIGSKPSTIAASKAASITFECRRSGNTDASVRAAYGVQQ